MDAKDWQLLSELDKDARQSNKQLAKKLRLSQPTIAYRIARLQRAGIIKNFHAMCNVSKLGYLHFKVLFRFINTTLDIEQDILATFKDHPNVVWLVTINGDWDLNVTILAKSMKEFNSIMSDFLNHYGQYILEKDITVLTEGPSYNKAYLIGSEPQLFSYGGVIKETIRLDDQDRQLLKLISQNARAKLVELAQHLKLTPDAVKHRLRRLEKAGIILGYRATIDFTKTGYRYLTLLVRAKNLTPENEAKIKEYGARNPYIIYNVRCIGSHDFQYEIEYPAERHINDLLRDFRNTLQDAIMNFELLLIDKEHKLDFYPFKAPQTI